MYKEAKKEKENIMPKVIIPFSSFIEAAGLEHIDFINTLHQYMEENDCKTEIKEAANGYVVSYIHKPSKRTIINYVFRKEGLLMRVYADNVSAYVDMLTDWPDSMKDTVKKAGICKRLIDPEKCNARCLGGFDFTLDGDQQQTCRYAGFMFLLSDETKPCLQKMVECEMQARK